MKTAFKEAIKDIPIVGPISVFFYRLTRKFKGSKEYWESRYCVGGTSGCGSSGVLAEFKAEFLNKFVSDQKINSVVEFGCGDGNQLALSNYPKYIGLDVSKSAIEKCNKLFASDLSKRFILLAEEEQKDMTAQAELSISLDVIYHLVEEDVFEEYMRRLFAAGSRYVIIYSSDFDASATFHVRHRKFSDWVQRNCPNFKLIHFEKNRYPFYGMNETGSLADFYVYERLT